MPSRDAELSADGSVSGTGSLLPSRSANTSNSNFFASGSAAAPPSLPPPHPTAPRDGSNSPTRRAGSSSRLSTLSGFPRSASTGTFHPSYYRRSASQQQLHLHSHRHDESHPPHMTRGEDLVEGARLPRARGAGATLSESRSVVAALVAQHDAEKKAAAARAAKKQTSDGGADDDCDDFKGGDAKVVDLGDDDDHLATEDGPWHKQITLHSLVFGTLLGVLFAVITNKLNLTAGIIPSLGMAATLLGYFAMNGWSRLVTKCGFEAKPFTQQENTMMQTFISACAGAAFSGGFGSYLIAMDRQSYENVGVGTPGNRPEDVFEPSLAKTIPYMFCISFVGIFMLVQLRKRFIIDYDLPYPSGTAGEKERETREKERERRRKITTTTTKKKTHFQKFHPPLQLFLSQAASSSTRSTPAAERQPPTRRWPPWASGAAPLPAGRPSSGSSLPMRAPDALAGLTASPALASVPWPGSGTSTSS